MALAKYRLRNINQKLTVFVGGSIALALTVLGIIAVSYTSSLASEKVYSEDSGCWSSTPSRYNSSSPSVHRS